MITLGLFIVVLFNIYTALKKGGERSINVAKTQLIQWMAKNSRVGIGNYNLDHFI